MRLGRQHSPLRGLRRSVADLKNRLSRVRYFRGHGVHSPFVYSVVRQVFMCRVLQGNDRTLYDALLVRGVQSRRALELQNLMTSCGFRSFAVVGEQENVDADFLVILRGVADDVVLRSVADAALHGAAVAVMTPYADAARERMCRALVAGHGSTTIDNRGYLLMFNDRRLPKQHFKI